MKQVNGEILVWMKNGPTVELLKGLGAFGTGVGTAGSGLTGDAPVKNWGGVGVVDMGEERLTKLATFSYDAKYNTKKYACAQCPLGCGGAL